MQKMGNKNIDSLYIVNFSEKTELNCSSEEIMEGKSIIVSYNGIVALSMPPQIYAEKIRIKK